jgi:hypothetical protein
LCLYEDSPSGHQDFDITFKSVDRESFGALGSRLLSLCEDSPSVVQILTSNSGVCIERVLGVRVMPLAFERKQSFRSSGF